MRQDAVDQIEELLPGDGDRGRPPDVLGQSWGWRTWEDATVVVYERRRSFVHSDGVERFLPNAVTYCRFATQQQSDEVRADDGTAHAVSAKDGHELCDLRTLLVITRGLGAATTRCTFTETRECRSETSE